MPPYIAQPTVITHNELVKWYRFLCASSTAVWIFSQITDLRGWCGVECDKKEKSRGVSQLHELTSVNNFC